MFTIYHGPFLPLEAHDPFSNGHPFLSTQSRQSMLPLLSQVLLSVLYCKASLPHFSKNIKAASVVAALFFEAKLSTLPYYKASMHLQEDVE